MSDDDLKRQFAEIVGRVGGDYEAQQNAIAAERQSAVRLLTEMITLGLPALPAVCQRVKISHRVAEKSPIAAEASFHAESGVRIAGSGPAILAGEDHTTGRDLFVTESGLLLLMDYATTPGPRGSWQAGTELVSAEEVVDLFGAEATRQEIIPALVAAVKVHDTGRRAERADKAEFMSEGMQALAILANQLGRHIGQRAVQQKLAKKRPGDGGAK